MSIWTHGYLLYSLAHNKILLWFILLVKLFPFGHWEHPAVVPWVLLTCFHLYLFIFLSLAFTSWRQDATSGSFCIFSAPTLQSATGSSSRILWEQNYSATVWAVLRKDCHHVFWSESKIINWQKEKEWKGVRKTEGGNKTLNTNTFALRGFYPSFCELLSRAKLSWPFFVCCYNLLSDNSSSIPTVWQKVDLKNLFQVDELK